MAILKCKMCGGDVELLDDRSVGMCQHCGCTMTFPKIDDEQRAAAFNRGNHFRRIGEFDKALAVYERIVQEDDNDAEAHWCCALCRFGIEYVEDPATFEWMPTCHRASFDSFLEDVDYLAAVEHSDGITRRQYQKDAAKITEVQRGILATARNAEPYDIFICYKEKDDQGVRTDDSTLAQDLYYHLKEQGRRVFYARVSMDHIAGTQYEPYIFAALNSAKVMIVVGTKPEYLNAVWVKNEWSRFLAMMKKDHHKLLLPCYRGMDPYDLPEQLSVLQSYDMAKIGFIQDLIRGVSKVLDADKKPEVVKETVVVNNSAPAANIAPLLKRAFMFLEDGDWSSANEYCEKVLDLDPECAQAYLGKLMAEMKVTQQEALKDCSQPFHTSTNFQKAVRFGDDGLKETLQTAVLEQQYKRATAAMTARQTEDNFRRAAELFNSISGYQDSAELAKKCLDNAEAIRKDAILAKAADFIKQNTIFSYEQAIHLLTPIADWKWAGKMIQQCYDNIQSLKDAEEEKRLAAKKRELRKKRNRLITLISVCVIIVLGLLWFCVISPEIKYSKAISLMENGNYWEAIVAFQELGDYRDSKAKSDQCKAAFEEACYRQAEIFQQNGEIVKAAMAFGKAGDYLDAKTRSFALWDQVAVRDTLIAGTYHTVGLKADGTVVAVGNYNVNARKVTKWTDIVAISAGGYHTVGLKADGTVVAVGSNDDGQCDVSDWTDIVAISAGGYHTVGLKADGTVVALGSNNHRKCDVSDWTDIVAISAGGYHTIGLKADGTVVAVGRNDYNQCDVTDWADIVAISAGTLHTVGLKADGTVVAVGRNNDGQCNVSGWTDIVAISAGGSHTIGLKSDGTVVAVGSSDNDQCAVSGWAGIVAISAGGSHTIGLKADGTVVAVGYNISGQCDVSSWTNIKVPEKK